MVEVLAARKRGKLAGQGGGPGGAAAQVEDSALVRAGRPGEKAVPVEGAEEGPGGDRLNLDPARPKSGCSVPGFLDPAHLLLAGAAVVNLGDGHRTAVARPHFQKRAFQSVRAWLKHAHGLHVGEPHEGVSAAPLRRIAVQPVVEEPVAGQIVVQPHHVGRAGIVGDGGKPVAQAQDGEAFPQGMVAGDASAEQVPAHPAAGVVELCLMGQR